MDKRIPILFGTETGNAEYCAEMLAQSVTDQGYEGLMIDMDDFEPDSLVNEKLVFVVTSTHGNGDPPANAANLLKYLRETDVDLSQLKYAVCGLGDTSFAYFAQCGKDFDAALEKLGAQRVIDRVDCDDDFDDAFESFQESVIEYLSSQGV